MDTDKDKNKKIIVVVLLLIGAIALTALILYFLFFKQAPEITPGNSGNTTPGVIVPGGNQTGTGSGDGGGNNVATTSPTGNNGSKTGVFKPILRQISTVPTAGGIVFDKNGQTLVRYIERGKGHAYETSATSIRAQRISNTTIPQIYEAVWKKTGDSVIMRFLKETNLIQTFSALVVPGSAGEGELRGTFLTANIKSLAVSPSGNQIFYLTNTDEGSSGIISTFDGKKGLQIFDSPLREWTLDWPKEDTVTATSKAGGQSDGLLIFVDTATGKREVVLSQIQGLTALVNSDLSKILYSESKQGGISNQIMSYNEKNSSPFNYETLPEKCVWSKKQKDVIYCAVPENMPSGIYPDDWYQGRVSFRDEVWKQNTTTGQSEFIMNLGDASKVDFDATNLILSEKENFLLMINKNDLTLWEIQLAK
jgi:hypothetical protein